MSYVYVWLGRIAVGHVYGQGWIVLGGLLLAIALLSVALIRIWPHSRRWVWEHRLHRISTTNASEAQSLAKEQLDGAIAALDAGARTCLLSGRTDEAAALEHLLRQLRLSRDRVAAVHISTTASRRSGRDVEIERLSGAAEVEARCLDLASRVSSGVPLDASALDAAAFPIHLIDEGTRALR